MLTKDQKNKLVGELSDKFKNQKAVVFTDFAGLEVKDMQALRRELKKEGVEYKVYKKTLAQLALKESGQDLDKEIGITGLQGQIAFAFDYKDEITPAKIISKFARKHDALKIVGGILGSQVMSKEEVIALAKLPSITEMRAKAVGTIAAPLSGFVRTLQGTVSSLVYALNAIKEQKN